MFFSRLLLNIRAFKIDIGRIAFKFFLGKVRHIFHSVHEERNRFYSIDMNIL